jgi:hypothetical protein
MIMGVRMTEKENKHGGWLKELIVGLVFLVLAGGLYWYFINFESSAEASREMPGIMAWIYNSIGKNLTCGLLAALGIIPFTLGIIDFFVSMKKTAVEPHKTHPNFRLGQNENL